MGNPRYTVDYEKVDKSILETMVETAAHLETDEATQATITDEVTGRSISGAGRDADEALEAACRNMGISLSDLDEELED